jgi:hypothetical protein
MLEQLPRGIRQSFRADATQAWWKTRDHGIEIVVRTASTQQRVDVCAKFAIAHGTSFESNTSRNRTTRAALARIRLTHRAAGRMVPAHLSGAHNG